MRRNRFLQRIKGKCSVLTKSGKRCKNRPTNKHGRVSTCKKHRHLVRNLFKRARSRIARRKVRNSGK